jgi:hypothetical protein
MSVTEIFLCRSIDNVHETSTTSDHDVLGLVASLIGLERCGKTKKLLAARQVNACRTNDGILPDFEISSDMVLLWNARSQQSGTIKLDDASTEMCRTATTTRRARPFRTAGTENVNPDTSLTGSVFIGAAATVSSLCRMGTSEQQGCSDLN